MKKTFTRAELATIKAHLESLPSLTVDKFDREEMRVPFPSQVEFLLSSGEFTLTEIKRYLEKHNVMTSIERLRKRQRISRFLSIPEHPGEDESPPFDIDRIRDSSLHHVKHLSK